MQLVIKKAHLVIPMLNNLKYFDFLEVDLKDFEDYCTEFQSKGRCTKK